jgi:hypothetical protein
MGAATLVLLYICTASRPRGGRGVRGRVVRASTVFHRSTRRVRRPRGRKHDPLSFNQGEKMSNSSNNNNNNVAGVRARPEQAREKRRRRPTRDTQRRQQLQQVQQVLQDMADTEIDRFEILIWWSRLGEVLTRFLGCFEDRDRGDPEFHHLRKLVLTALLEPGVIFDAYDGPDYVAFRRDPLKAQLDKISKTLELAVLNNDVGGVALAVAMALAMLDNFDRGPGRQGAESSAPPQAAV